MPIPTVGLLCGSHQHGILHIDNERIEIKCRWCARDEPQGTVVMHYFDVKTGKLLETKKFQDIRHFHAEHRQEKSA